MIGGLLINIEKSYTGQKTGKSLEHFFCQSLDDSTSFFPQPKQITILLLLQCCHKSFVITMLSKVKNKKNI